VDGPAHEGKGVEEDDTDHVEAEVNQGDLQRLRSKHQLIKMCCRKEYGMQNNYKQNIKQMFCCFCFYSTLIKKKINFSPYRRKFRVEQLQSHI
jgi:hypothetical protein